MGLSPEILTNLLWSGALEAFRAAADPALVAKSDRHFPQFATKNLREDGTFEIGVNNDTQVEWFTDFYQSELLKALQTASGGNDTVKAVKFVVTDVLPEPPPTPEIPPAPPPEAKAQPKPTVVSTTETVAKRRAAIAPTLHDSYTFDNFVTGPSNSYAYAAAMAVAKNPGKNAGYTPLFIWGDTGLGKTHLMEAIGHKVWNDHPGAIVCYCPMEEFINQLTNAIQNHTQLAFREKFRKVDLLLLDDIQFVMGHTSWQEELFNTFQQLTLQKKQIVLTCDVKPSALPGFESRLISRFEGGMVVEIESPSFETRYAILKSKSKALPVTVPDDVLKFIATNIRSHVRAMEGALNRAALFIEQNPAIPLSVEAAKRLLKDNIEEDSAIRNLSVDDIIKHTADHFHITVQDIKEGGRAQMLANARQMAMWLARKLTQYSLQEIGIPFNKNHATVHHAIKTIQQRLDVEKALRDDVETITLNLGRKVEELGL